MERANLPALAVDKRQYRILVAVTAASDRAVLTADKSFIRFNGAAHAAHWRKIASPHCLTNAMTQKPCAFESDPQSAMQLVYANALFAGANEMDRSQLVAQLNMAILENAPDLHGERLAASVAFVEANPIAFAFKRRGTLEHATMRANAAIRPNARLDIGVSGGFIVEVSGGENGHGHGELLIESTISKVGGHVKYNIAINSAGD